MKTMKWIITIFFVLQSSYASQNYQCYNPVRYCNSHLDYFKNKVSFKHSTTIKDVSFENTHVDFSIESNVTGSPFVTFPKTVFKYRLVKCGCIPISIPKDRQIIYTNPTGVYVAESPTIGLLERFSLRTLLYSAPAEFIYSPAVLKRIAMNETIPLPFADFSAIKNDPKLSLSLIGTYGVGSYVAANTTKPYLLIGEVSEQTALGRTEYLKLLGLLFDKVPFANCQFERIKRKYLRIKKKAQRSTRRPTVFFNYPFPPSWTQPSELQYITDIVRDSNAEYKFSNDGLLLGRQMTFQEIVGNFSKTDFLINSAFFPYSNNATLSQYINSGGEEFKNSVQQLSAVTNRNVWSNSKRISSATDFFTSTIVKPHVLLKDYVKIFHPHLFLNRETFYLYRYSK